MAEYFDITDWNEKPWFGTKGSRNKIVVENPSTGSFCYFKTSLLKPEKDYKHEFWSEIIASEIGKLLGFNVLKYDIAFCDNEIGCISEFMNTEGENELTEGIQYLTGYNTAYKPSRKESKKEYTFQFICDALKSYDFQMYIPEIIKIIIYDSIIGNGDRHQENWGIITDSRSAISFYIKESKNKKHSYFTRLALKTFAWVIKNVPNFPIKLRIRYHRFMPNKFAPIYDNGSCLGRELLDERITQLLADDEQLASYIRKGTSEIHWEGKKLSHFDLIKNIAGKYPEFVKAGIHMVKNYYDENKIVSIVNEIDKNLPTDKIHLGLPDDRKRLIIKMVSLRYQELVTLLI